MTTGTVPPPPAGQAAGQAPLPDDPPPDARADRRRSLPRRLLPLAGRHRLLLVLLAAGAVLRGITQLAYRPAILYVDSYRYLSNLKELDPTGVSPIGYELMLRVLLALGDLPIVPAVQHLTGLAMGVAIYALLVRRGVWRWLAVLAAAPVTLDAYQLQIEQNVMSDVLFQALLVAVLALLTWRRIPGHVAVAAAGILLAGAVLVRLVGQPVVLVLLAHLLLVGPDWRGRLTRAAVLLVCFAAPLAAYATYYHQHGNRYAISNTDGAVLYGRVATFVDCRGLNVPSYQLALCPDEPLDQRQGVDWYTHSPDSPRSRVQVPEGMWRTDVQRDFAVAVIRQQPLDFACAVGTDFLKGFRPTRTDAVGDVSVSRWQFTEDFPRHKGYSAEQTVAEHGGTIGVSQPLASFLRGYQLSVGYTSGVVLGLALLAALVAAAGVGRARDSGLRAACFAWAATGAGLLLTAATFEFSWRYQLPSLVLLPVAGALAVTALTGRTSSTPPRGTRAAGEPDSVDEAALDGFRERYGTSEFASVVVLIAAYNEADGIGPVIDSIPKRTCDLDVDTLVVVDGATDPTAEVALRHGAYTCVAPVNRGQGAALRLGYRIARERGARYVVTTDADGQYDITELPRLLRPLLDDEADFVTGSRRLGRQETSDPMRHLGVHVFAWVASVLTRQRITDTSFGFRAMRTHVTAQVTLMQPQYQSSELLIGALARGFRVVEVPMTMRQRTAGRSKKGNNLVYGLRYARVVLGTWLREYGGRAARGQGAVSPMGGPGRRPARRAGT